MDTMLLTAKVPSLSIFPLNVILYLLFLCIGRFAATTNALNIVAGPIHVQFKHNPSVAIPQGGPDFPILQHSESSAMNEDLTSFNLRCFLCKEAVVKYQARLESKTLEAEAAVGGLCKELKLQKDDVVSLAFSGFGTQHSSVVPFTPLFASLWGASTPCVVLQFELCMKFLMCSGKNFLTHGKLAELSERQLSVLGLNISDMPLRLQQLFSQHLIYCF